MTSTEFNRNPHKQGEEKELENIDGANLSRRSRQHGAQTGFWLEEFAAP